MNKISIYFATGLLFSFFQIAPKAQAADSKLSDKCKTLTACVETVSTLTQEQYILAPGTTFETTATQNTVINSGNADALFTLLLELNGLARVPTGQPKTWKILRAKDARDSNLTVYEASFDQDAIMPNTHDLATMNYVPKFPVAERLDEMARNLRSFLPANARIIPDSVANRLRITASIPDLKRCLKMVREMDLKPTTADEKRWNELKEQRKNQSKN